VIRILVEAQDEDLCRELAEKIAARMDEVN